MCGLYNSLTQFQSSMTAGQEMIHQNDSQAYNTEKNINNTFWCQKWQMNLKPKFDMRLAIATFLVLSNSDLYIKANQSCLTIKSNCKEVEGKR